MHDCSHACRRTGFANARLEADAADAMNMRRRATHIFRVFVRQIVAQFFGVERNAHGIGTEHGKKRVIQIRFTGVTRDRTARQPVALQSGGGGVAGFVIEQARAL